MRKKNSLGLGVMMLSLLASLVFIGNASAQEEAVLEFISYTTKENEGVELQLSIKGLVPEPTSSTSESPARITFDLAGVRNGLPWTLPLPIKGGGNAKTVSAIEASGRTRVVINLDKLVEYSTRVEGENIFISLTDRTVGGGEDIYAAEAEDVAPAPAPAAPVATPAPVAPAAPAAPAMASTPAAPREAGANTLRDVKYFSLPGDKVQVRLIFAQPPAQPSTFTIDNPPRIVLDLAKTAKGVPWASQNINVGVAQSISAIETSGRTRAVLNLVSMRPFNAQVSGNEIVIDIEGEHTGAETAARVGAGKVPFKIDAIDFRRGESGEGRVIITTSEEGAPVDSRVLGNSIYVDFLNTQIPENLIQRLDVVDFATPVRYIDTVVEGSRVKLVINMSEDFEHMSYQAGKTYTIDIKKPVKQDFLGKKEGQYVGEKLSLNFQDIEVRAVLQLIADFTGLNLVASDSVQGSLTLRLKNVPWDQALELILKTKGLDMRQVGNVILVGPSEEIASRERLDLEAKKQIAELKPLVTEMVPVNYAKASEIAALLQSGSNSLLSTRGKVMVDARTNTLLITETRDKLTELRDLINKLDIPIRQVMIDSRIVIANNDFSRDIGARFGVTDADISGNDLIATSGSYTATDAMVSSWLKNLEDGNRKVEIPFGSPSRLNVNMPVTKSNAGRFAMSILRGTTLLDLEFTALQAEGRGEVVSSPRVITSNGKTALIEQGTEIPYQQASSSGATNVSFKKAVLSLQVTPQITPDDRILMDLSVTKDSVGQVFFGVPSIDTKEVNTQVLINNGDTVVLGGVYEQERSNEMDKVPFLGDLPFVGALFRQTRAVDDKTELLIFVTPKILKEGMNLD
ncbi:MAG: type IV pilus secretin PilQ [Pseudomonadota bacterium]